MLASFLLPCCPAAVSGQRAAGRGEATHTQLTARFTCARDKLAEFRNNKIFAMYSKRWGNATAKAAATAMATATVTATAMVTGTLTAAVAAADRQLHFHKVQLIKEAQLVEVEMG